MANGFIPPHGGYRSHVEQGIPAVAANTIKCPAQYSSCMSRRFAQRFFGSTTV